MKVENFADWLKLKTNTSRADFVRAMSDCGHPISAAAVYQWSIGKSFPKKESIEAICKVFGMSSEDSRMLEVSIAMEKSNVSGRQYPKAV